MKPIPLTLSIIAGVFVGIFGSIWLIPALQDLAFGIMANQRVGKASPFEQDPNTLEVFFCGTGSPLPEAGRAQSCIAVIAGNHFFLFDAGAESAEVLSLARAPWGGLDGVFLTHFHSDHFGGLGEAALYSWTAGRRDALPIYGGPGVSDITEGLNMAYSHDRIFRTDHHGENLLPSGAAVMEPFELPFDGEFGEPLRFSNGLLITPFRVRHDPIDPAYGYRIEFNGRIVVITGDTVQSDNVVKMAEGADILIHDALSHNMMSSLSDALEANGTSQQAQLLGDTLDYHATPVEAAETANAAGVNLLVLTHVTPPVTNALTRRIYMRGVKSKRDGAVILARDGLHLKLPVSTGNIEVNWH